MIPLQQSVGRQTLSTDVLSEAKNDQICNSSNSHNICGTKINPPEDSHYIKCNAFCRDHGTLKNINIPCVNEKTNISKLFF